MNNNKYYILLIIALAVLSGSKTIAQNIYIQKDVVKKPGIDVNTVDLHSFSFYPGDVETSFTYLDGLGYITQKIAWQASPKIDGDVYNSDRDIIQMYRYDASGQQSTTYLPYSDGYGGNYSYRVNDIADQQSYYNTNSTSGNPNKIAADASPYSQKLFENSPLHRLIAEGSIGAGFQPDLNDPTQHYKSASYRTNLSSDHVMIISPGNPISEYGYNLLSVSDTKDEDGAETLIFRNATGQIILKRQVTGQTAEPFLDTYYLYNTNGSVNYLIPPKASHLIATGTSVNFSMVPLSNLVYSYIYDLMGRLVSRKVPNSGLAFMVYDPMNRPVLIQDANLRKSNQWYYIKYDARGRAFTRGIYQDNINIGQSAMQTYITTSYGNTYYETRSADATTHYYTNNAFPNTNITPLAFAYFDDYDLTLAGAPSYSYSSRGLTDAYGNNIEATPTTFTQGMLTMLMKRSVGSGLNDEWLSNAYFYDNRKNIIQVQSNNQLNYQQGVLTDYKTVVPDFTGKPLQMQVVKVTGVGVANTNTILTTNTYDEHNARLLFVDQKYNNQPTTRIGTYKYNQLGQLVSKALGTISTAVIPPTLNLATTYSGTNNVIASNSIDLSPGFEVPNGSTFSATISNGNLQVVDYRYNIRGQLLSINNSTLTNDNGITNNDGYDLFGMQFLYDKTDPNLTNMTPSFSGRIAAVKWMSRDGNNGLTNERSYAYKYDQLNRLTDAIYAERAANSSSTTAFNINQHGFDEAGISYDNDGNILTLQRNYSNLNGSGGVSLDNLQYTYDPNNPDQLYQVADAGQTYGGGFTITSQIPSSSHYSYDDIGNLVSDPYKQLSISYNIMNKTDVISKNLNGSHINYTYDAIGNILRKQVFTSANNLQITTDYIDGFVYTNTTLSYFNMPEGRGVSAGGSLKPEYVITDQQGNARFSFEDNGTGGVQIRQENSYYAFGAVMPASTVPTPSTPNINLYNGNSEWQNSFGNQPDYYQTGMRNYDPEIGRFIGVDTQAESAESLTTYQYAGNNPIVNNDPMGNTIVGPRLADINTPGDPDYCPGCIPYWTDPDDPITGDGGAGDPAQNYDNSGAPTSSSSYGGDYNNGTQDGNLGTNYSRDLDGSWTTTTNWGDGVTYDKQVVTDYEASEDGKFTYTRIGWESMTSDEGSKLMASDLLPSAGGGASQGGGASSSTWDVINNGVGAFGIGWGVKGALIDAAAHSGELVTPALETYTKVADGVGIAGGVFAMGAASYNMYNQYQQHHRISDIHVGDVGDFTVGAASVGAAIFLASNPIGWAIGAGASVYFIGRIIYQETHQEAHQ